MAKFVKNVTVIDYQRRRAPSKHYVYVITVVWSDGSEVTIYRRYSQLFEFHTSLLDRFPEAAGATGEERIIPFLPGKKIFGRSHTHKVAQSRAKPIDEYLKVLISLPAELSRCDLALELFEATNTDIAPPSEQERELPSRYTLNPPSPCAPGSRALLPVMVLDQYRAVADYTKQDRKELSFKTGDIFEVVEKNDNGWWFVSNDSASQGWVPATFLEPLDGELPLLSIFMHEKYITTAAYAASSDDEIGYEKGVVVRVLEKKLDGWWQVEYQGKVGWTPGTFLKRIEVCQ
ncbi:uncharacterized protein MONBRDRAFT_17272 [Monosiga brevicollis MX1]|uniref:Uncharacterized protein n=1 Tax=Monosiga brevicollis TaxID=81824 RepID=A9UQH0_MONBE|nr:uncharacterized protein MONBRDRAFT_17272 [Monosiga brevicollis MX1]EDQ92597.1 predicted protein [Monosiga brevicollis MX1]|eukprot:XP_001742359.1 hypothetical protein [Monosiga brevicollis MX1]